MRTWQEIELALNDPNVDHVPNDEMIVLFQHYVDSDTLPNHLRHKVVLECMKRDGVIQERGKQNG
jgi:hypothetical protein